MWDSEKVKKVKKTLGFVGSWLRPVIEVVALIVVFVHLIPEHLLENSRANGLAAIIFLGTIAILLLAINYVESFLYRRKITRLKLDGQSAIDKIENDKQAVVKSLEQKVSEHVRKARYAETFPILNDAFTQLHRSANPPSKQVFIDFCNKLSMTFEAATGEKCAVCIKISIMPRTSKRLHKLSKLKAGTFVRDSIHLGRVEVDRKKNLEHFYDKNTDFEHIFTNLDSEEGRCFFSNNLASIHLYKNTSFLALGTSIEHFLPATTVEEKERTWPLKYISTINAPICPGISTPRNAEEVIGFLCVDCLKKDVFIKEIDSEILIGCADALYNPMKQFFINFVNNN